MIKTLIFEDDARQPLCILMHGDREVSTKNLARAIGVKTVAPCTPEVADRHSGYQVGGTSPFGLRRAMPVYMQRTIAELPRIYINGGARGFLVAIDPKDAQPRARADAGRRGGLTPQLGSVIDVPVPELNPGALGVRTSC